VTVLQAMACLMAMKLKYNFSNQCHNDIVILIIDNIPAKHNMSKDLYQAKKIVAGLVTNYEKVPHMEGIWRLRYVFDLVLSIHNSYIYCRLALCGGVVESGSYGWEWSTSSTSRPLELVKVVPKWKWLRNWLRMRLCCHRWGRLCKMYSKLGSCFLLWCR
jgi:hypothetical protein